MSDESPTPGDQLRALPAEAQERGTRFVSAHAMQARLFSVYDAAAAAEDALALVQQQLTLTLNRSYYEADEIESMASQLDSLLALESLELSWKGSNFPRTTSSRRPSWSPRSSPRAGGRGGQPASFLTVAMRSTGRWSPTGTGVTCRWVTPASG